MRANNPSGIARSRSTGELLNTLYLEITRKYCGHAQGLTVVDDYVASEWTLVPHFYRSFYVFQYATSLTAAEALALKVKAGDPEAINRFVKFLHAGGSKHAIELLKDAGVDMTSDEPLELTVGAMDRAMSEIEAILTRLGR